MGRRSCSTNSVPANPATARNSGKSLTGCGRGRARGLSQGKTITTGLTKRQAAILAFIQEQEAANGKRPTVRKIAEHFGIRSANGAHSHIKALRAKGFL